MKNVLAASMLLALSMGMSSCTGLVDAVLGTSDNPTTQPTTQPTTKEDSDKSETKTLSIGVNINTDDPLACSISSEDGNIYHLFATKDEEGLPLSLIETIIQDPDGNACDMTFDESGRLVFIEAPNGATYSLEWTSETFAALTAIDPTTGNQIITYIDLLEDADEANLSRSATRTDMTSSRNGNFYMKIEPISSKSNTRGEEIYPINVPNPSGIIKLNLKECDNLANYPCGIDVYNQGILKTRLNGVKVSDGVYEVQLPKSMYPEYSKEYEEAGTGCEDYKKSKIAKFMHKSCILAGLSPKISLGDILKRIVKKVAAASVAGPLSIGITAVDILHTAYCEIIDNDVVDICKVIKSYKHWAQDVKLAQSYNVSLWPRVWNTTLGLTFNPVEVDLRNLTIDHLDLNLGGTPSISSFTLNPPAPMHGVSYDAIAILSCIPSGSTVYMNITGTDGYYNEKTETVSSTSNSYKATLYVPGAASGVVDVCKVIVTTPDGKEYPRTASLVFQ